MSVTTIKAQTVADNINSGDVALQSKGFQKAKAGTALGTVKVVVTGLTAAAAIDITTVATKAAATITGLTLGDSEYLPPIGEVSTLRVTAVGTGATGPRVVTDAGGTPAAPPTATAYAGAAVGLATLSDDGKTLTFEGTVTGFVLTYRPRTAVAVNSAQQLAQP